MKKSIPIKKIGKKTLEWIKVKKELDQELSSIKYCELRLVGCFGQPTNYAHAVKRRVLKKDAPLGSPKHIKTCVKSCLQCHIMIEGELPLVMEQVVMKVFNERR